MIEEKLIEIFYEKFQISKEMLERTSNIIEAALLDSVQFVKLTMELENEFDIEFDDSDYREENFVSIAAMSKLVKTKQSEN